MRHRLVILLLLAAAVGLLSGCSGQRGAYETITAAEVGDRIREAADLGGMQPADAGKLSKTYAIEMNSIADFVLYTAVSNVEADELAIIKVKDEGETEAVMDQIRHRVETQTVKFRDYRPEAYHLIENHVLKATGPFVFFAVSAEAVHMERAFDEALK
ncbi:DUF4358 domain-containing protein [Paenibacillus sp. 1P07SE]|uniref:DUF4358 domain-containing protein n=1 Tax=Paenibacillus sp. 1P07SE TaxID=3132209 RepID=UPI0039A501D6